MAITSLVRKRSDRMQFQSVFEHVIDIEAQYNPPSVGSKGFVSEVISVDGVEFGDFVLIAFEADMNDLTLTAHVQSKGNIDIHLHNPTSGAVDLDQGGLHIVVLRPLQVHGH